MANQRHETGLVAALLAALLGLGCAVGSIAQPAPRPQLGLPESIEAQAPSSPEELPEPNVFPIDLATALRLAGTNNLDIARAREVATQARIQVRRAQLLMVPNLSIGSTYLKHEGQIAKTEGNIITANKDGLFVGGGPSLAVSFADAVFAPLVARQAAAASQAGAHRAHNDPLLAVSEAYFAVLRARRRLARVDVTLEYLTSDKASPLRGGAKGLLPIVDAMQKAGVAEALKAEVYRVQVRYSSVT